MAFLKDKTKFKTAEVVKALDTAVASSSGLAEFIGCIVCLAVGAFLGTEIALPRQNENVTTGVTEDN